ncbi:MAG: efflux RND transporter periplasmic adaptor subunit [Thermodesulfobacteriota bacterium]
MSVNESPRRAGRGRAILMRLWGALPILVIVAVIVVLAARVSEKSERLEAGRQGLATLEARQMAMEKADRIAAIIGGAADPDAAMAKLVEQLAVTPEQARTILHLPLGQMTGDYRDQIDRQIAYLKTEIAEGRKEPQQRGADVNVVALTVAPRPITDRINLPGVVKPWVSYDIVAEVNGNVVEKSMEKGKPVKAGQVIAEIDPADYEIALDAAQAAYKNAEANRVRLEKLFEKKMVSKSEVDEIIARAARFRAERDAARLNLKRCTIRSPIDGMIDDIMVERGQYVNAGRAVAEVMQVERVKVTVGIPESDVGAVRTVDDFEVAFDALDGRTYPAQNHFLSLAGDPAARLYDLELAIDNPDGEILPDMFARVDIVKQKSEKALSVPLYAVVPRDDAQTVYVVNDEAAHVRTISTGIQEGWRIEVTGGLCPGDRVIVVGHRRISDGQPVNVIRTVSDMEAIQ